MAENLETQLLEMEHAFWEASTDPGFYEEHVADDAVLVFPYGVGAMDKEMTIYAVTSNEGQWESHEFEDVRVMPFGEDAGLITYRATATRAGDEGEFNVQVSSAYVQRDGAWKLVFHQQTLVL